MERWSRKLRRSGYTATVRHQVIKTALDRWDKMQEEEDAGVRLVSYFQIQVTEKYSTAMC